MALYRCGSGGKKSLVLPTNPELTITNGDGKLTLSWTQPTTEISISHYNIYFSQTAPSSLTDMTLKASTTSKSYALSGLTNDKTYYVGIQAVSTEGYENASIWKVKDGVPSGMYFVCVGAGGQSYYSTNGTTWVAMSGLNTSKTFLNVVYGNGIFVCVGSEGLSYYSTNGTTWVAMSGDLDTSYNYFPLTYGSGKFITIDVQSNVYCSTDGKTWSSTVRVTTASSSLYGLTYGNDRFVCVGSGLAFYSLDGTTWVAMSGALLGAYQDVTYGNGRFVCVGKNTTPERCSSYSTDGETWVSMSGLISSVSSVKTYYGVAYGNGRFVCVGTSGYSFYSTDGTTWVAMSGLTSDTYYDVTYQNGRFVCVGASGLSFYSTDGTTWVAMSGLNNSNSYWGVTSK